MKKIQKYAIRTSSGKFLRLHYELSATIEEYYEQGIEEDEFIKNAIPKITFVLTEKAEHTQIWTTNHKHICEKIIQDRFNFHTSKIQNSIDFPKLNINYKDIDKEYYTIKEIYLS